MKKQELKSMKGITLVALIITIIVLLILAVVTIAAVTGDGILSHASNARDEYQEGQAVEENTIGNYVTYLDDKVGLVGSSGIIGGTGNGGSTGESGSADKPTEENTPETKLGKYVRYDVDKDGVIENDQYESILWRVLRDDDDKVELITADAIGEVTFSQTSFDEARNNYNRAVELMVEECREVTGISSVRNVGGPAAEDELSNTNTVDFSEITNFSPIVADTEFAKYEGATNGIRKGDSNWVDDFNQMRIAGVNRADNKKGYWLSSRCENDFYDFIDFYMRQCGSDGEYNGDGYYFGSVTYESTTYNSNGTVTQPVRPVLTLTPGTLDNASGAGTKAQPIETY